MASPLPVFVRAAGLSDKKAGGERGFRPGPLMLDDAPLPLTADSAKDETHRDKIEALALFSAARALELKEKYAGALRLYQRAFRYDPDAADIARAIVPLAIHLKQEGVAVRYALKSVELEDELDPMLLRRLGLRLEEGGDWDKALKLYKRAMALRADAGTKSSDDVLLHMDAGRLLMLLSKPKEAADCFALVIDALDHPDKYSLSEEIKKTLLEEPGLTYTLFGDCFLQAGRIDEARAAFEKLHQLQHNDDLWNFHLAQALAKSGKPADALAALEKALSGNLAAAGAKPYELLAELLASLDRKGELIARLEKLRDHDAENAALSYFLAGKYLEADMPEKAEPIFSALAAKNPAIAAYKGLVEIYRKNSRFDALLSILGATVEKTGVLDTLDSDAVSLAKDTAAMRGLIEAARKESQSAGDKTLYGKFFALGLLASDAKDWDTAEEFFQAAAKAKPKQAAEIYMVWGIALLLDGKSARAAKVFQQAIDGKLLPDNNPIFYFYLAGALAMEDRADDALAAAKKAAEIKKDSVRFQARIGWVYYRAKRYDEAAAEYEKTLKDFDGDYSSDETREALKEVRFALSNICVLQNANARAEEWLEQVLDEFPDDPGALNDLGFLWVDSNRRLSRAMRMIGKAVEAEPDSGAYRDSLGWGLYRLGRFEEAATELEKAAEKQTDGVIFDHLGDAYQKSRQPDKARRAWLKAAELFRKEKDEQKGKEVDEKIRSIDRESPKQ